jgi:hypothetical protein
MYPAPPLRSKNNIPKGASPPPETGPVAGNTGARTTLSDQIRLTIIERRHPSEDAEERGLGGQSRLQ